jgi:hypothetical protein
MERALGRGRVAVGLGPALKRFAAYANERIA